MAEEAKPFVCEECQKSFTYASQLTYHSKIHTDERPFHCSECPQSFKYQHNLNSHMLTHTGERPFTCEYEGCGASFALLCNFERHILMHTGFKPFQCKECSYTCNHSSNLKIHMRTHTGEKPYVCTESKCGKAFAAKNNLKSHMLTHSKVQLYTCDINSCGKNFAQHGNFKRHQLMHVQRPFQCGECLLTFKTSFELSAHKKRHAGIKPYTCDQCPQAYNFNADLQAHKLIHDRTSWTFKCIYCSHLCMTDTNLKKHMRVHHLGPFCVACPLKGGKGTRISSVKNEGDSCGFCTRNVGLKERTVFSFLASFDERFDLQNWTLRDRQMGCGSKRRPDGLMLVNSSASMFTDGVFFILEIDERQHKGNTVECEQARLQEMHEVGGAPMFVLRYNPDAPHNLTDENLTVLGKRIIEILEHELHVAQEEPSGIHVEFMGYTENRLAKYNAMDVLDFE